MKGLVYDAKGNLEIMDLPKPHPGEGEALIRVKYAGICGSDMTIWAGGLKRIVEPVTLGHEIIGEVVELGSGLENNEISIGQRVLVEPLIYCSKCEPCKSGNYHVCEKLKIIGCDADGGIAQYLNVHTSKLHLLPDNVTDERAALCEPLAVALHMSRRAGVSIGNKVAIMGGGPIGLTSAIVSREAGASKIVIVELNNYRMDLAREMGFNTVNSLGKTEDEVVQSIEMALGGPADVSFECAATDFTLNTAIKATKIRGTILQAGIFKHNPSCDLQTLTLREQIIIGSRVYNYADFQLAIELSSQEDLQLEKMITKIIRIDNAIDEGFEVIKQGRDVMKILVAPNTE